jgi:hypothetical protein
LPEGLVEALIAAHGCGSSSTEPDEELPVNKTVQLSPFLELIGRIEHVDERGRVQILLEIMGRVVPVQTTESQLRPPAERVAAPRFRCTPCRPDLPRVIRP